MVAPSAAGRSAAEPEQQQGNWLTAIFGGLAPAAEAPADANDALERRAPGDVQGRRGGRGENFAQHLPASQQQQQQQHERPRREPFAPRTSPQPLRPYSAAKPTVTPSHRSSSPLPAASSGGAVRRSSSGGAGAGASCGVSSRGFGMSTPRFGDARFDATARALRQQREYEPRGIGGATRGGAAAEAGEAGGTGAAQEHSVARARGLHAAYAQCAALRRMLTALRVNRLLVRWRVATVYLSANDHLQRATEARLAMEDAVVEVHKRGEASAAQASVQATQKALLQRMLHSHLGAPRLQRAISLWRLATARLAGEEAAARHAGREEEAQARADALEAALKGKQAELSSTRKLVQKPTQLEATLRERDEELRKAQADLADAEKRIRLGEQRAVKAEDRSKVLQREVAAARRQQQQQQQQQQLPSSSPSPSGSSAPLSARSAHGSPAPRRPQHMAPPPHAMSNEEAHQVDVLRQQLSSAVADRHRLEGQLDGQRKKVAMLSEVRKRAASQRLTGLLLLRAHQALGPALRKWQMASLERAAELIRADGSGLSSGGGGGALLRGDDGDDGGGSGKWALDLQSASEARQSRILALQRELLDREAQLGAAHQASLKWREERAALQQELTEVHAQVGTLTAKVADAALAASAAAEREGGARWTRRSTSS